MTLTYEYYEQILGQETALILRNKIKLAVSRMPKYDWYAAGLATTAMPTHSDMTHVAFLFAANAMSEGIEMAEAVTIGLRESTNLANRDAAANSKRPGRKTEEGWSVPMVTHNDVTHGEPIWEDSRRETGYDILEEAEITQQLRAVVTATLIDSPTQCEAVMLYLFDADADEYGWGTRKAEELGLTRQAFNIRLRRGLERVGEAWMLASS